MNLQSSVLSDWKQYVSYEKQYGALEIIMAPATTTRYGYPTEKPVTLKNMPRDFAFCFRGIKTFDAIFGPQGIIHTDGVCTKNPIYQGEVCFSTMAIGPIKGFLSIEGGIVAIPYANYAQKPVTLWPAIDFLEICFIGELEIHQGCYLFVCREYAAFAKALVKDTIDKNFFETKWGDYAKHHGLETLEDCRKLQQILRNWIIHEGPIEKNLRTAKPTIVPIKGTSLTEFQANILDTLIKLGIHEPLPADTDFSKFANLTQFVNRQFKKHKYIIAQHQAEEPIREFLSKYPLHYFFRLPDHEFRKRKEEIEFELVKQGLLGALQDPYTRQSGHGEHLWIHTWNVLCGKGVSTHCWNHEPVMRETLRWLSLVHDWEKINWANYSEALLGRKTKLNLSKEEKLDLRRELVSKFLDANRVRPWQKETIIGLMNSDIIGRLLFPQHNMGHQPEEQVYTTQDAFDDLLRISSASTLPLDTVFELALHFYKRDVGSIEQLNETCLHYKSLTKEWKIRRNADGRYNRFYLLEKQVRQHMHTWQNIQTSEPETTDITLNQSYAHAAPRKLCEHHLIKPQTSLAKAA